MGMGRFVFTPILPEMIGALGLSVSQAGWLASANFLGYLLGAILGVGGWGQGRERAVALTALVATTVLAAAMGLTVSYPLMLALRFLAGIASAFGLIFLSTAVFARLALMRRDDLQFVLFSGVGIGIAVSALMTGALYINGAAWFYGWLGAGLVGLLGTLVVFAWLEPAPKASGEVALEPRLNISRPLTATIVSYGIFGAGYVVTATFLIAMVRAGGGGPLQETIVWLAAGLAAIPSTWFWARVARAIGLASAFALACVVEAVGVGASVLVGGAPGLFIAAVLLGGTFVAITAQGLLLGRRLAPAAPRRAVAVLTTAFSVGQMIAPVVAGYLADWTEGFTAPSIAAACMLLLAGCIIMAGREGSRI